jgi:hypothetical protein
MADRHEELVGIGFTFEDARFASDHEKWYRCFMKLVEYKDKNGHCNIPNNIGLLGGWIHTQRALFRSKKLMEDRYEKLVGIGFAYQWQNMYQNLLEQKETKGHCFNVPKTLPLGRWLRRQRWIYRHGILRCCLLLALMIKKV